MDRKILGERIRERRKKLWMTQGELGERIGCKNQKISYCLLRFALYFLTILILSFIFPLIFPHQHDFSAGKNCGSFYYCNWYHEKSNKKQAGDFSSALPIIYLLHWRQGGKKSTKNHQGAAGQKGGSDRHNQIFVRSSMEHQPSYFELEM